MLIYSLESCVKAAAAYECQNNCKLDRKPQPVFKYCNESRNDNPAPVCDPQIPTRDHLHNLRVQNDPQYAESHHQNASHEMCSGGCRSVTDAEGSDGNKRRLTEESCVSSYCPSNAITARKRSANQNTSATCSSSSTESKCYDDGIKIKETSEVRIQDRCCATNAGDNGKGSSLRDAATCMCSDVCCTSDEQPIESQIKGPSEIDDMSVYKREDHQENIVGQVCDSHLEAAFRKYASYLEIGRCICRSMLPLMETCCSRERRLKMTQRAEKAPSCSKTAQKCSKETWEAKAVAKDTSIVDAEGTIERNTTDVARLPFESPKNLFHDVEKGCVSGSTHISVSIMGMTCTGCSKKGIKVLTQIRGVTGAIINFVASTGGFDLASDLDPMKVITQFERETGFKCSLVEKDSQTLDIIMSKYEAKCFEEDHRAGITSVSKINKYTFSVYFDPTVIGARSVLSMTPSRQLARPSNDSGILKGKHRLVQMAWNTGLAAACTIPVVVLAWSENQISYWKRSIISLVLATCVQGIAVPEFYIGALKSLIFSKVIEMDMLIVVSITAAYGYSVVAFALTHHGHVLKQGEFFETSTLLTTLVLIGRLVSMVARMKAFAAVSLKSLQAEKALLVSRSGETVELDARLLEYGDLIMVPSHVAITTDGEIVDGSGVIDESMITGESNPVIKTKGDTVFAGTMNGPSPFTVRLTRLPGQNSIRDIADLVQNALGTKPRLQDLADRVAGWFIPVVVAVSCVVFATWISIALKLRHDNAGGAVGLAISYSIAVLAISCPCALGLAVPMVLVIAGGMAAKSGVIIKQVSATEIAHRTTDVVFDKTGTLTSSVLEVVEEIINPQSLQPAEAKSVVFSLLKSNNHLVSSAVVSYLESKGTPSLFLTELQSVLGAGLEAKWNGKTIKGGNPVWAGVDDNTKISRIREKGLTVLAVTLDSELIAAYGLKGSLRNEAKAVIQDLCQRQIVCHMISGDETKAVENVGQELGFTPINVASRQTPSSKQEYVKRLIEQRKTVLFCGDGTNDAVAVAQAHIGVQIGSVSDIMRASADVVLTGGLEGIPALLDISKAAYRRIIFNFIWSGIYNVFAILLAAGAFVRIRIAPAYAGLGEIVSVLPVVLVALSLMRLKRRAL